VICAANVYSARFARETLCVKGVWVRLRWTLTVITMQAWKGSELGNILSCVMHVPLLYNDGYGYIISPSLSRP
jgi:hypothetical protein